jgi:hypothetical protein
MKKILLIISILLIVGSEHETNAQFIILGSGISTNGNQSCSPVNIYYRRTVCQFVYTASELSAAGLNPGDVISQIGWFVTQPPIYEIPDYTIKMKHVAVGNVSDDLGLSGWTIVKNPFTYMPVAGDWDMLPFTTNFVWNGTDNIGVELCWAQVQPNFNQSGQCRIYSTTSGYRYSWTDDPGTSCGLTPLTVNSNKPQAKMVYTAGLLDDVGVDSIPMGGFYNTGTVVTPTAMIQNYGSAAQTFSVTAVISDGTTNIYSDTITITSLAPYNTQQLSFTPWTSVAGNYTITITTQLSADQNNANDSKSKNFIVGAFPVVLTGNISDGLYQTVDLNNGALFNIGTISTAPFPVAEEYNGNQIYRLCGDFTFGTVTPDGQFTSLGTITGVTGNPTGLAWNWNTQTMYVMILNASQLPVLCTLNMYTLVLTPVGTGTEGRIMAIDFADDGFLYGPSINPDNLYKINPANGSVTAVGPVGLNLNFGQDVSFDLATNQLYTITAGEYSHLGTYNLISGEFTSIADMNGKQHATFVITNAPGSGSNNDMMVYSVNTIPSGCTYMNSETISAIVKNNGYQPQSNIPVFYYVNGTATGAGVIPGPVASGEYINYHFTQPANLSVPGNYSIQVCTGLAGDQNPANNCKSFSLTKHPHSVVPYSMGFEPEDSTYLWKIVDLNGGPTWQITEYQQLARTGDFLALYEYSETLPANDWIFSTCMEFEASKIYNLSFWYSVGKHHGIVYPEKLKVAFGNSPDPAAMTNIIVDLGAISNVNYQLSSATFSVPSDGIWFIGWHAYSNPNMFYVSLDDISVDISQNIHGVSAPLVSLYPNPAADALHISCAEMISRIDVHAVTGELMYSVQPQLFSQFLDVSLLSAGVYCVRVHTYSGVQSKVFVVAR